MLDFNSDKVPYEKQLDWGREGVFGAYSQEYSCEIKLIMVLCGVRALMFQRHISHPEIHSVSPWEVCQPA